MTAQQETNAVAIAYIQLAEAAVAAGDFVAAAELLEQAEQADPADDRIRARLLEVVGAREITALVAEVEQARLAGRWGRVLELVEAKRLAVGIGPGYLANQLFLHSGRSLPDVLTEARLGALRQGELTFVDQAEMSHAPAAVRDIRFSRDGGRTLTCAVDGDARLWWADGEPMWQAPPRRGGRARVGAVLDAGDLWISRALGGTEIQVWRGPSPVSDRTLSTRFPVQALAPALPGMVGAACGATVELWDVAAGERLYSGYEHPAPVTTLQFTGRSHELMVSGCPDGGVRLWSVADEELLITRTVRGLIADVVADGQGRVVVVRLADGGVRYWPAFENAAEPVRLAGDGAVTAVDVSADGTLLLVGRADGRVHLHDVERNAVLPGPAARPGTPTAVRFRGDGLAIATGWLDGGVRVLRLTHTADLAS